MPSVLNPNALTTLANFKEAIGVPAAADATNDNKWERYINRASDAIERQSPRKRPDTVPKVFQLIKVV